MKSTKAGLVVAVIVFMVSSIIGAAPHPKNSIELVSPNGKNKITIVAGDTSMGIWMAQEGERMPRSVMIVGSGQNGAFSYRIDNDGKITKE